MRERAVGTEFGWLLVVPATTAAVGTITPDELEKRGYRRVYAAARATWPNDPTVDSNDYLGSSRGAVDRVAVLGQAGAGALDFRRVPRCELALRPLACRAPMGSLSASASTGKWA